MPVVKISKELIPYIEKCMETIKDEFGVPKYKTKMQVLDEAVRDFLKKRCPQFIQEKEQGNP